MAEFINWSNPPLTAAQRRQAFTWPRNPDDDIEERIALELEREPVDELDCPVRTTHPDFPRLENLLSPEELKEERLNQLTQQMRKRASKNG